MTNMIQNAKDQAAALAMAAYKAAAADGTLPEAEVKTAPVEIPKDTANGDYTTTFALAAAKALGKPPRVIAQALLDHMDLTGTYFTSAEIAGPGFLNFRLGDQWYAGVMNAVETEKDVYGTNDSLKGQKIMVEFVSANPTGPMHMGNARGGVLGDTLASVLTACGADVSREFYVNDAGHQIDKFARSIEVRYLQLINGEDSIAFPEDGYQGEDIKELAKAYYDEHGDSLLNVSEQERQDALAQFGLSVNLPRMKTDLERYKIHYDTWFYESTLHESGYVADSVKALTAQDELNVLKRKYDESQLTIQEKDDTLSAKQYIIIGLCILVVILVAGLVILAAILLKFIAGNRKLKKSVKIANEHNELKTKFIQNISSQMEPTLNTLATSANELLQKAPQEASQMQSQVAALKKFSDDIQELSSLENSLTELYELGEINVGTFCENVMDKVKEHIKIDVTPSVNAPKLQVKTNKEQLERILLYLLKNAAFYTEQGRISLEFKKRGAHTHQFIVTDTGIGIPAEQQENIFKPFTEVKDLTTGDGDRKSTRLNSSHRT